MITLTPLSSSASSSSLTEPVSYFLQLDDARILLDMGQRDYRASAEADNWEYEEKIRELAPTLSLVLLSHSPSSYLGLYAYARAHWGLKCPVYATQATTEMGRIVCLADAEGWRSECAVPDDENTETQAEDAEAAQDGEQDAPDAAVSKKGKQPLRGPFVPTVDEVHEAFNWIKQTLYNQPIHLGGNLSHLLLTPFPSGHVLGGTMFKIRSPTSGTVLYAVGMNHTSERHLDGIVSGQGGLSGYAEDIRRPDLLIVEGGRSLVVNPKRKDRESCVLDVVTSTLKSGNSVLMPCDPSPRLLELLVLLDQHWTYQLKNGSRASWDYPLCLVSQTATDMASVAKNLINWMGGVVGETSTENFNVPGRKGRRQMDSTADIGPVDFPHVIYFNSPTELLQAFPASRPKLVLAVPPTMSFGPSRFLFTAMASQPGNVILLTNRGQDDTLTRDLFTRWEKLQADAAKWGRGQIGEVKPLKGKLSIEVNSKIPLVGAELEAWEEQERLKKDRAAAQQALKDRSRKVLEADDLASDSESEGEGEGDESGQAAVRSGGAATFAGDSEDARTMSFDIFVKGQQTRAGSRAAGEMARFRMFPYVVKTRRVDPYGEGLDIGQWLRKGREIEEEQAEGEAEGRDAKRPRIEEEKQHEEEKPSKFVSKDVSVKLAASVEYVDMDGLFDGQALKAIIASLQPRKMIVIKSTEQATDSLLDFFKTTAPIHDIFHPGTNETVKIGEQVASYSMQMGESIASLLSGKWSKYEGYEVAMVDAKLAYASGSTVPMLETANTELPPLPTEAKEEPDVTEAPATEDAEDDKAAEAAAEAKGAEGAAAEEPAVKTEIMEVDVKEEPIEQVQDITKAEPSGPGHLPSSLFIGDLRLLALKTRLASQSISAAFAGEGVLVCGSIEAPGKAKAGNSIVVVRKLGEGRVILEGSISATYFAVRKELYGSYAHVTTV